MAICFVARNAEQGSCSGGAARSVTEPAEQSCRLGCPSPADSRVVAFDRSGVIVIEIKYFFCYSD